MTNDQGDKAGVTEEGRGAGRQEDEETAAQTHYHGDEKLNGGEEVNMVLNVQRNHKAY